MSINLDLDIVQGLSDFLHYTDPRITDPQLAGIIKANLSDFHGLVRIVHDKHFFSLTELFKAGKYSSRIISITPYSSPLKNKLISIQRFFMGVTFEPLEWKGDINPFLRQGRRVMIAIAKSYPLWDRHIESNQQPCQLVACLSRIKTATSQFFGRAATYLGWTTLTARVLSACHRIKIV